MNARGTNRSYEEYDAAFEWSRAAEADAVKISLPGFKREEIRVLVDNHGHLRTNGERPVSGNRWSRFQKDFQLPADCNVDGIRAKFENDTLTITLPKKSPSPQAAPVSPPVPAPAPPSRPEPRRPAPPPPQRQSMALPEPAKPSPQPRAPVPPPPQRQSMALPEPAKPSPQPRAPAPPPPQRQSMALPEPAKPSPPPRAPAPPPVTETLPPVPSQKPVPERWPSPPRRAPAPPPVPATLPPAPSQKPVPERRPPQPPPMPEPAPEVETNKKNNGGALTEKPGPADVPKPRAVEQDGTAEEGVETAWQRRPISASRGLLVNLAVAVVVLVGITAYVWHTLRNATAGGGHGHGEPGARSYSDEM